MTDRSSPDPDALFKLGLEQLRAGQSAAAAATLQGVVEAAPEHGEALIALGSAEMALSRWSLAETHYRRALDLLPHHPAPLRNLGILLGEHERHAEALVLADTTLAADPDHSQALLTRGNALTGLSRLEEALQSYSQAARFGDVAYEALTKLGLTHAALSENETALRRFGEAIALQPNLALAPFRRSLVRLLMRDFSGGWDDYEARLSVGAFVASSMSFYHPVMAQVVRHLAAAGLPGRSIKLLGEQGLGDQVMFASMIGDLARDAAKVTCVCDARLERLFAASITGVTFQGLGSPPVLSVAPDETLVAMGSLGRLYRRREADFLGTPFLRARPEVREAWAARLGPRPRGLRIGLSWRGGVPSTRRGQRSLSLDQLAPVLDLPDCDFVSLQYGDVAAELEAVNAGRLAPVRAFDPSATYDFEDLAGLIENLDVVVSVQTAVVHLAGATGADCLTLVPHNPEWRYAASGSTMPWYRSVQLFRQATPGAWEPVVRDVEGALRRRLAERAT
ncbi:tetratricopeptide repeat protein [Phenylobacterium sp.]|uniref:CHAT domain-containing protein n=1 Tax=Phenylobacterium sp. TaxID=1871053 RepID=UPI00286E623A|nr:tetratricopeptide repeat protein [Phenylobacterium sp.]